MFPINEKTIHINFGAPSWGGGHFYLFLVIVCDVNSVRKEIPSFQPTFGEMHLIVFLHFPFNYFYFWP